MSFKHGDIVAFKSVKADKYINVSGGNHVPGTKLVLWHDKNDDDYFRVLHLGGKDFAFQSVVSEAFMRVEDGKRGADMLLGEGCDDPEAAFVVEAVAKNNNCYLLKNKKSQCNVNLAGGDTSDCTQLIVWDNGDHIDNQFHIEVVHEMNFQHGDIVALKSVLADKYVNVAGAEHKAGTQLILWRERNTDSQFRVVNVKGQGLAFQSLKNSELFIQAESKENGARIKLGSRMDIPQAIWTLDPPLVSKGKGFVLENKHSEKLMNICGGGTKDCTLIIQWDDEEDHPNVQFNIEVVSKKPRFEGKTGGQTWTERTQLEQKGYKIVEGMGKSPTASSMAQGAVKSFGQKSGEVVGKHILENGGRNIAASRGLALSQGAQSAGAGVGAQLGQLAAHTACDKAGIKDEPTRFVAGTGGAITGGMATGAAIGMATGGVAGAAAGATTGAIAGATLVTTQEVGKALGRTARGPDGNMVSIHLDSTPPSEHYKGGSTCNVSTYKKDDWMVAVAYWSTVLRSSGGCQWVSAGQGVEDTFKLKICTPKGECWIDDAKTGDKFVIKWEGERKPKPLPPPKKPKSGRQAWKKYRRALRLGTKRKRNGIKHWYVYRNENKVWG